MHIFKDLAIQTLSGEDEVETSISDDKPGNHVKITNASQMNPSWENRSGESYIGDASEFSSNPGLWRLHFVSCSLESQTNAHVSDSERKQKTQTSLQI